MTECEASVRGATSEELPAVMNVLDGAMLDVEVEFVRNRTPGEVLVAVEDGRILGALVLDGDEIVAVAVRPGRRGQGIGSALVEAVTEGRGRLVAEFDTRLRPFYEPLGFDVVTVDGERCLGVRRTASESTE